MNQKLLLMLCLYNCASAMELIPLNDDKSIPCKKYDTKAQIKPIRRHEDLLFLSLKDAQCSFNAISSGNQKKIKKALKDCTLFAIGQLPHELQQNILSHAVDYDEYAANKFFCMPLMYVYEEYEKIRQCGQTILGEQELSIHYLFSLYRKERDELFSTLNPGVLDRIAGKGNGVIDEAEYQKLIHIIPEIEQSKLKILPSVWERMNQCCEYDICKINDFNKKTMASIGVNAGMGVICAIVKGSGYAGVAKGIGVTVAVLDGFGLLFFIGYGAYLCRNHIIRKARFVGEEEKNQSNTESTEDSDIIIKSEASEKGEDLIQDTVIQISEDDEKIQKNENSDEEIIFSAQYPTE